MFYHGSALRLLIVFAKTFFQLPHDGAVIVDMFSRFKHPSSSETVSFSLQICAKILFEQRFHLFNYRRFPKRGIMSTSRTKVTMPFAAGAEALWGLLPRQHLLFTTTRVDSRLVRIHSFEDSFLQNHFLPELNSTNPAPYFSDDRLHLH